jgi:ribokinase
LLEELRKDKVDTTFVGKENDCSTGVAIITVDEQANNSIIVVPGANYKMTIEDIDHCIEQIKASDFVVLQLEVPIEVVKHTLMKAKEFGKYTILNPAPAQHLDSDMISMVDLLIPNETELEILSGIPIKDQNDVLEAGKKLIARGVKALIVTLGEQGCAYLTENEYRHFKAYRVSAVDTTAAGDSFVGGITIALMNGLAMDQAIEFASKVGALTVMKQGAQSSLPYLEEVTQFKGELL